ncbi:uncharacterized protein LOC120314717 [Crotalus tigris]|uniref:uncharacterized protein LOC120314717 n=1 Tax=Crotalus tigris TaxID=88082 RepID=UPI00192F162E|nr:uncharacterized protein LOC120314717 [Crotalus tigris]
MQKRVVYQRWLLPKRILESMKLFYSSYSYLKPIIPWQVGGINKEQGSRLSKIEIAAPPRIHARSQVEVHLKLQLHLAKKHLEIYLDALPVTVRTSWRHMLFSLRIPLPKIILSHQPMLPRRTLLPFACRKAIDRIEMTVQRNHFASLWELTTHYVKALEQLMPKPLSQPLRGQKRTAFLFTKIQWVLPPGFSMETLELHVKRKRIQHEWGFPVLIQKSIKSFIYQPPSSSSLTKTKISVHTLVQELSFLSQDICKNLELHVQKTKLYRQWGLPQRVLASLKKLQPAVNIHAPRPKTLVYQTRRTISTYKTFPLFQTKTVLCTMCCKQRMVAIPPHVPHKLPLKGSNYLEKICLHLSKKYVEIQLEVFPDIVMDSWKHNVLATRQPLPKLISHGPKILQPRRSFLPFMQKQEAKRLEMAVQLHYFSSLWGLAKRYVEAVDAMIPRSYASPLQRKSVPIVMFSETQIPFLQPQEQEIFELHIRKKRLHHEWGFPALIQSSLKVFMQGFPPSSTTHRTTINVHALPQKLSFLPWPTCNYLEFHVQKLKLQRLWGLPKRILESLKYFRPSAPLGKAQLPQSDKKTKLTEARFGAGENQRACCKSVESTHSTPKKLDLLKEHIRRKYIQVQLETLPRLVRQSSKESSTISPKHLPKLIEAGKKSPTNRPLSLLFLPPSNINMLEQNLRHKHLTFLWGVSKKYMESLTIVVPVRPFPARTQKASIAFLQPKAPFVQKEAREMLEYHIQIKRLHHLWGLPFIIQSSLQAFTTYLSIVPHPPQRIRQEIRISVQDLPFVSKFVQQNLASSIKKMVIHSQWGLPKRLHKFLRGFCPTPPGDHEELREFRNFLVSGPKFKKAQRITRLPQASFVDGQPKKAAFLTDESADLLERHIQHKKFQHEWGLPSVLQRSLRAFAPLPPDPQKASARLAIAAPSSLQSEVRVTTTPKLLFLDPVTKEHLEAHTKRQITRHRWGLPKQVQESMKTLLPPTYFRQPEDLTERIPLVTHDQVYPARIKELSEARARHRPTIRKAPKWRSQIEEYGGRQLPMIAGRRPKSPSPHIMNQIPTLSGNISPKFHQESWAATFYTKEAWDALEFHIRRKKIQHDWGLPSMVKKSLNAFAHHPPELHSTTATSGGRISIKSRRKGATHRSLAMVEATIPHLDLHFVSTEIKDSLEAHLKNWTMKHKWELPKRIRSSLRAIVPPQPESQSGMHQPRRQHSRPTQPHKIFSHHERKTSQRQVASTKGASKIPNTISHQRQSLALAKLLFLTEDNRHLLEFHIQQKKIQHAWGVPLVVLRSLNAFFPFPIKIQSTGKKRLRANQWAIKEVKVVVPFTFFLSMETKEVLEAHMKRRIAEHKWSIPKRIQQTLGTLSTPQPHFQPKDIDQQTPLCRQCKLLLQTTDDSQTEKEEKDEDLLEQSEKDRRRKRRKKEYFQPRNQRRSTSPGRSSRQFLLFSEPSLSFLSDEVRNYLEFHIQQKKIQRAWSLPSMVLKSLQAFAPFSSERKKRIESTRKRIVKTHGWNRQEVKVIVPNLSFLSEKIKDILEAHLKRRMAEHRWGMPKAIQKLLGSFVPSRPPSQPESIHEQPSLCWKCKSLLGSTDVSEMEEEDEDLLEESKKDRRIRRRTEQYFQPRNHRRSTSPGRPSRQFLLFSEPSLSFLSDEARNYLEFHIQQKKIQRAWSLPSTVLKSLQAFAPFSSERKRRIESTRKRIVKTHGWSRQEVKVIVPNLSFLSKRTKDILEAHLKRRTAEHRWGMPKAIQKLLGSFVPSRPPSQHESIHEQPSLCWKCKSLLGSTDVSETEKEDEDLLEESKKGRRMKRRTEQYFQPRNQRRSTSPGRSSRQFLLFSEPSLSFLSDGARNYLEFHIQQKKIQRAWSLPSTVLKSLQAFAPFSSERKKRIESTRKRIVKTHGWSRQEVKVIVPNLSFLSERTKDILEAHLKRRTAEHRWGTPKAIQKLLGSFVPSRPPSQYESIHEHPSLCWKCKSLLGSTDVSEMEEEEELWQEIKKDRRRKIWKGKDFQPRKQRESTHVGPYGRCFLVPMEGKLPLLSEEARNYLEFHIQQKKIQRAWNLPSLILKSLRAFAPFPLEEQKDMQDPRDRRTKKTLWDKRDVPIDVQSPLFLSPDVEEHLDTHVRHITTKHQWGLLERVQQPLQAFLPLRSHSPSELEEAKEGSHEGSKPRKIYRKTKEMPSANGNIKTYSEVKLPFFVDPAWNLLEFHIQHKKLQHAWGLPFMVFKSIDAFAPYVHDSTKHPLAIRGAMTAHKLSWDREFHMIAPNLSFLSSNTKQHLEAHLRNLIAVHRWELPKHAQATLRAFLHPGTLSSRAQSPVYKSTQISLPQTWGTDKSPMKKSQLRKKEAKLWTPRSSSTAYFRSRKVDFLDDGAQDLLEFHILHKKIQHAWGLPALIQKSLRLFAPSESQKEPQLAADVTMKTAMGVAANKSWIVREVKVAPQQLRFLQPDIKKQLERHIRHLTAKHRWQLPKLVQDTLVAFIPQMGEEMKEPFSTYDEDLLRSSSSSGAPDLYDSELFYELHQTPMGIRASWLDTQEPSFCFDRKTQHTRTVQGKMARREAPEVSKLQKLPPQRIESDLYLKDEQIWASDLLGRTQDPRGPFFSTPVSGYQKGRYNVSSSSESLSMEKYPSQRTDWLATDREALPCSSNMSLKKDILKQLQSTSQRKEDDRYYPVGSKQSQLSKVSGSSWVPNRFCRIGKCPCLCHLPSSREGSMLSLRSVRKQRPDLTWGTVKETETDSSSLLTEDRSSLQSILAKKADVRFSSLPSEDAISELSSGATLRNASLPEPGYQGALFQEERVFASNTDLQNVTTSGSEPANTSGPSEQFSSSTKGMVFQEAVQPSLAVEQRAVQEYRREGEQTVPELGRDELDGGKLSSIEKVEEKTPDWGKDLSTKEPFTDIRPLIEHKTTKMSGTTQKRRKPMSERAQPSKPEKKVRHTHFLVRMEPDEKMSILGRILERKLRLRHGLSVWKYSHGKVVSRIKHKIESFRQSFRVRSRTRSKDSTRRNPSHSPESTTRSSSSSVKARSRGRSRERRSKMDVRRKELPQNEL